MYLQQHFSKTHKGNTPLSFILFMIISLLMCFVAESATGQFVRFNVNILPRTTVIDVQPLDFTWADYSGAEIAFDAFGRVMEVENTACLAISSPQNILVLVELTIEDEYLPQGRTRPFDLKAYYINDMGQCPTSAEMASRVGNSITLAKQTEFNLSYRNSTTINTRMQEQFLTAFIFLIGNQRFDSEAGARQRNIDMQYRGRYVLDIVYL